LAMLGMIFSPLHRSSRMIKRLAEINAVNGDSTATDKYLRILDATLFHKKWSTQMRLLFSEGNSAANNRIQEKRKQLPVRDILRSANDHESSLQLLVKSNPANIPALDYLLAYYLLQKDVPSFLNTYDAYLKGKSELMPRLYGEVLLIGLIARKATPKEIKSYGIPEELVEDFMAYKTLYEGEDAFNTIKERFPHSYWMYYHFARIPE